MINKFSILKKIITTNQIYIHNKKMIFKTQKQVVATDKQIMKNKINKIL